jgi:hypothetical protein
MALYDPANHQKNREWRRYVRVKARIRSAEGWRDASILNVSSRGLMVHAPSSPDPGRAVEIRSGDQAIRARVVWKKGQRIGLRSEAAVPVLDLVGLSDSARPLANAPAPVVPACLSTSPYDGSALLTWSRLFELGSALVIGACIVSGYISVGGGKFVSSLTDVAAILRR